MARLSVFSMLRNLARSAPPPPTLPEDGKDSGSKINTTVRLDPEVRQFVDEQAAHYGGISSQAFINMMLRGLMLSSGPTAVEQTSLLESRFYELFEMHGLAPIAISSMLKESFGITLATLKRPDQLLEKIDNELIDFLSVRFGVLKGWLQGERDRIYTTYSFDKRIYGLASHLQELRLEGARIRVHFIMDDSYEAIKPDAVEDSGWSDTRAHAGFVLELEKEGVKSYEIIRSLPWGYRRTREEMQTFLGFLQECRNSYCGVSDGFEAWFLDSKRFGQLFNGDIWPQTVIGVSAQAQVEQRRSSAELYDLATTLKMPSHLGQGEKPSYGYVPDSTKLAYFIMILKENPLLTVKEIDRQVREHTND